MKLLLDECLPRRLKYALSVHEASTVPEAGWAGIKNGRLLGLAEGRFEAFITMDSNLTYQQNLTGSSLAILVLSAHDNTIDTLLPLVPAILVSLSTIQPGQVIRIVQEP